MDKTTNYFAEKFGFFDKDNPSMVGPVFNEKNYSDFMSHLNGKEFAEFLKEWGGLTKESSLAFFIDGLNYVQQNLEHFDT